MISDLHRNFKKISPNHHKKTGVVNAENEGERGEHKREQWGSQWEFILSCVGYSVGLGNVWRYPYLCFKNGGGAFLIPYIISSLLAGLPIFYMELCIGQFSSLGPITIFGKLVPIMQGIGFGMVIVSFLVSLYYNMIIAWVLFYLFASFRSELQWAICTNDWNTEGISFVLTVLLALLLRTCIVACHSNLEDKTCQTKWPNSTFFNKTCWNLTNSDTTDTLLDLLNATKKVSPAEEYFERYVLNKSDSFEDICPIQWKLALCLMLAWFIVFLCLIKGVKSSGKVVYFTATFPYVVLLIFLIRGVTLDGASDGIYFFITPKYSNLKKIEVWKDAATQVFYSLGPAFGGLITMASYNKFKNNCFRDALIVTCTDGCTSTFAGFVVFSIAGFMAKQLETEVGEVVRDGTGLAFIAYPEAIVRMPVSPLWSILFFFMLLTLGLDSQFAMLETCTTSIMDQFPSVRDHKTKVIAIASIICFLLGLPFCCRGGIYVFVLFNDYSAGYCLVLIALMELITVSYIYGLRKFLEDIELMLGTQPYVICRLIGPTGWYFKIAWSFFTPIYMIMIFVFSIMFYGKSTYGDYQFSPLAEGLGFSLSTLSWTTIPIFIIVHIVKNRINKKPLMDLITPSTDWCPAYLRKQKTDRKGVEMNIRTIMVE